MATRAPDGAKKKQKDLGSPPQQEEPPSLEKALPRMGELFLGTENEFSAQKSFK